MNIFQLVGDMLHLASILILLLKIHTSRSAAGKIYTAMFFDVVSGMGNVALIALQACLFDSISLLL